MKTVTKFIGGLALAAGLAQASLAFAQEAPAAAQTAEAFPADADVLSAEDMAALWGGDGNEANVVTEQTLTAINKGNVVIGQTVGSGELSVAANAFAGFAGIGNFVMNTGHNNNLQSSMNVSVMLAPSGAP